MTGRRIPIRRPITIPLGAQMTIRQRLDDQLYELYGGSRLGAPELGTFSGAFALDPGTRVRATWREESRLWEIDGPVRQTGAGAGPVGFFAIGGSSTGDGILFTLKTVDPSGVVATGELDPATNPPSRVERIRFSPDGAFIAITYSNVMDVYAYSIGVIGALIDTVTLPASATSGHRHGLTWHPDSNFIAVGFDDATGDSVAVYSWDGSTITLVDTLSDPSSSTGCTAIDWHPDGDLLAAAYSGGKIHALTWNGSTLADVDTSTDMSSLSSPGSVRWGTGSGKNLLLYGANQSPFVAVIPWNGSMWDAQVEPSVPPDNGGFAEADWYPQGDRIVYTSTANKVWGYPWTGSAFGTRVVASGGTRNRRSLRVDPSGTYFVVAVDGATTGGKYGEVFTFNGDTITNIPPDFGSGVNDSYTTEDVDFPPSGMVSPAQQVDASDVTYTPTTSGDWSTVPDDVMEALDELAARVTALEP